jgi:fatty acid desaturase
MLDIPSNIKKREWYKTPVPKKELRELMKRDNWHGITYVGIWFVLLILLGFFASILYPSLLSIPIFFLYGVFYSASNARWHECSHGTPFKTQWINEFVFFIATAMEFRDVVVSRWSHSAHHSYTMINSFDPEILLKRPPSFWVVSLNFFNIVSGPKQIKKTILHALGKLSESAKKHVPKSEYKRMFWMARLVVFLYSIIIGLAILTNSLLPIWLFILPRFYGGLIQWAMILLQHSGLNEDVWDHRQNSRTLILNPFFDFLYMTMQYHTAHHMYPNIPFHKLKKLNELIQYDLPEPNHGIIDGFREMIPALIKQRKDPNYYIDKVKEM